MCAALQRKKKNMGQMLLLICLLHSKIHTKVKTAAMFCDSGLNVGYYLKVITDIYLPCTVH